MKTKEEVKECIAQTIAIDDQLKELNTGLVSTEWELNDLDINVVKSFEDDPYFEYVNARTSYSITSKSLIAYVLAKFGCLITLKSVKCKPVNQSVVEYVEI